MHYTIDEAVKLVEELKPLVKDAKCEVVVCPTFVCLDAVKKAVEGTNIKVGAQNMHFEEKRSIYWRNRSKNVRSYEHRLRYNWT